MTVENQQLQEDIPVIQVNVDSTASFIQVVDSRPVPTTQEDFLQRLQEHAVEVEKTISLMNVESTEIPTNLE